MELGDGVREQRRGKERSHQMRRQRVSDLAPARGREEKEGCVDPESGPVSLAATKGILFNFFSFPH